MNYAPAKRLQQSVRDIMRRKIVTVSANHTMPLAAAKLADDNAVAAVVVDNNGSCIGLLTAADFMRHNACLACFSPSVANEIEAQTRHLVRSNLGSAGHAITPKATIEDAARAMCAAGVSCVPVLDDNGQPLGIIHCLDVLEYLVNDR